jgi:uroporphyrinogen-III synthase
MTRPRVIVTRPQAQALPWVESLRAAGVDAVALPLIDIVPIPDAAPLRRAWQQLLGTSGPAATSRPPTGSDQAEQAAGLEPHALAMFVSANAVQHFFAVRPPGAAWPAGTRAGSTGPGTSAALRAAGVPEGCIAEPAPGMPFETESLWAALQSLDWCGQRVLVVRGEDGRDWLADTLRGAGAEVAFLAAYRRVAARPDGAGCDVLADAIARPQGHVWHFSSSEAVGHLVMLVPGADWSSARALASHPRIEQAARRAGFGAVGLVGPQVSALVEALASDPGRYNPARRE